MLQLLQHKETGIVKDSVIPIVAFSASWTHKHDGDNTPKFIKIIVVDVGSGANRQ